LRRLGEVSQLCVNKILIADDEPSVRLLVKRLLIKNYIVLEASNGEEAVNIARTEQPDLILMDILMPKIDGYTACYMIKTDEATKDIPVIMLTAVAHKLNKQLSQAMDADGYMTKPFSFEDLIDTVNQFLPVSQET
jgi:CheY-like chemotaxis protein